MAPTRNDWEHLVRLAVLFTAGVLALLLIRPFFVPPTFGDLGHYRAAAVIEARERPLHYADPAACAVCHSDVVELQQATTSRHGRLACQSCHGALAAHVETSGETKPVLPEVVPLCTRCHESTPGRPARLPLVNSAEHSGGERCSTCHVPHAPGVS